MAKRDYSEVRSECGCRVGVPDHDSPRIVHCALHQTAQGMYTVLIAAADKVIALGEVKGVDVETITDPIYNILEEAGKG